MWWRWPLVSVTSARAGTGAARADSAEGPKAPAMMPVAADAATRRPHAALGAPARELRREAPGGEAEPGTGGSTRRVRQTTSRCHAGVGDMW